MIKTVFLSFVLLLVAFPLFAQKATISGTVTDTAEKKNLSLASVTLLRKADSTLVSFTRAGVNGKFQLPQADTGKYVILITYPRFADYMDDVQVQGNTDLGNILMTMKSKLLDEVVLKTVAAIRIKGDTTEFVADSFKVKEGATVEDLLKRLPGFSVNAKGEIVAQGKRVDKVLVDGEEFFGDDPTMATQNISAKAVDKVQVFETKTEQQKLTGMSTGSEGKTVNIKLKENAKKGAFGKLYAGTDFNKFIDSKALYNKFVGKKKISTYVTRTNVNAGSLNWEDRQKLGIENDYEYDELSGYYFSFGGNDEFNDWNLRGLPDAWTAGALYSDKWKEDKNNLNLSYRYNRLRTTNTGTLLTQNILPGGLTYSNRYTGKNALNQQHAGNFKYEWKIDSLASIKLTSVNTYKTSDVNGYNNGEFIGTSLDTVNQSFNTYDNQTRRTQTDNQLTYKQLFKKKNRQWLTVLRYGIIDDDNSGLNNTLIRYYKNGLFDYADTLDQQKNFTGRSISMGVKSTFSEPISDKWMLLLDYAYNKNHSTSLRNTLEKSFNGKYEVLVPEFSNNFEMKAFSHSGNALLRYMGTKIKAGIGSGISAIKLGLDNLDNVSTSTYNFLNFTPQAQITFTPKTQTNIGFNYRGTTRQPTINQLQPLRDNTDPLNEYKGNPDLKVGFNHGFSLYFNQYKVLKQQGIWANFNYNLQDNAITQNNTIDTSTGKRTYFPVNVNGNRSWNLWTNFNRGFGEKKPYFGISINGNGNRFVNFVNGERVTTISSMFTLEVNVGLDITDKLSFNMEPYIGYNKTKTTLKSAIDNNYFTYGVRTNGNVNLPWKMELSTDVNADLRSRINAFATNTNLVVWNAGLSKKFLKKDSGKISFTVNDILNDNKGFTRTINSTFISDDRFQRISRYFLLRFEWSFNQSPGGDTK
ncbi:MAG: outer membrane beta-barrel protein [Bacteroidetes bacterium]|nr:outer membrane beta-barrel protein [Bacteroidota bacterium]